MRNTFDRASARGGDLRTSSDRVMWRAALLVGLLLVGSYLAAITPLLAFRMLGPLASVEWTRAYFVAGILSSASWLVIAWLGLMLWLEGAAKRGSRWLAASFLVQMAAVVIVVSATLVAISLPDSTPLWLGLVTSVLQIASIRVLPALAFSLLVVGLAVSGRVPRWIPLLGVAAIVLDLAPLASTLLNEWTQLNNPSLDPSATHPAAALVVLGYVSAALILVFWFALAIALRAPRLPAEHGLAQAASIAGPTISG
jgi:hypothetical protein